MDVGGLWELAEIQHFPELQGSVEMERKLAAVKANLEKYIKTDYCQYLLDLGKKAQYLLINKSPLAFNVLCPFYCLDLVYRVGEVGS